MTLSEAVKVIVGLMTLFLILLPFVMVALLFAGMFSIFRLEDFSSQLPSIIMTFYAIFLPVMCLVSLIRIALIIFYISHIVMTPLGLDILRIILGAGIVLYPLLGMPAYYLIYVWPKTPPSWALKPFPSPVSQ